MLQGNFPDGGPVIRSGGSAGNIGASSLRASASLPSGDFLFVARVNWPVGRAGNRRVVLFDDGTGSNILDVLIDSNILYLYHVIQNSGVYASTVAYNGGTDGFVVFKYSGGAFTIGKVVGGTVTWGSPTTLDIPVLSRFFLGTYNATSGYEFDGVLGGFAVRRGRFTDAEIVTLTGEL